MISYHDASHHIINWKMFLVQQYSSNMQWHSIIRAKEEGRQSDKM
jgi:hypothetical protein